MTEVLFNYEGKEIIVECNINDKMKDIIDKYIIKSRNSNINLNFVYNDNIINKELKFKEQANEIDIKNKKMKILAFPNS